MHLTDCGVVTKTFTGEHLTTLLKKLVEIDSAWVPTEPGTSLCAYAEPLPPLRSVNSRKDCCAIDIRPTMIGTQAGLGVGASTDILLFVMSVSYLLAALTVQS